MFLPDPLTTICGSAIFCEMGWDSLYFYDISEFGRYPKHSRILQSAIYKVLDWYS